MKIIFNRRLLLLVSLPLVVGLLLMVRMVLQKRGPLVAPDSGHAVQKTASGETVASAAKWISGQKGFVVWSSNRFGSHDILLYSLPDGKLTQLTNHPHTEYFPRISPDGKRVVFARSRKEWVAQRNFRLWDIYLLDLADGKEQLIAEYGNVPTWSDDGQSVFFQRNGNQFVRHFLATGKEEVILAPGKGSDLAPSVVLETPSWSSARKSAAVTLRGSMRSTVVIHENSSLEKVGGGCQLNWGPGGAFLYHVDSGGKKKNAIYRVAPDTMERTLWYDSPTEYSHEYFPRVANNGKALVFGASTGAHQHDAADYEIFLWPVGTAMSNTVRLSFHTGNDCWPDIYLFQ